MKPRNLRIATNAIRVALTVLCLICTVNLVAQARPSQYEVKAAYLFNFGKFAQWPTRMQQSRPPTFDICILGPDLMGQALDRLTAKEQIDGRPVRVLRVKKDEDARSCAVAFVNGSDGNEINSELTALSGANVLTVGDQSEFLKRGGMIQFILQSNHVRFAVNLDAVNREHIVLSSELLKVAYSVSGTPVQEPRP